MDPGAPGLPDPPARPGPHSPSPDAAARPFPSPVRLALPTPRALPKGWNSGTVPDTLLLQLCSPFHLQFREQLLLPSLAPGAAAARAQRGLADPGQEDGEQRRGKGAYSQQNGIYPPAAGGVRRLRAAAGTTQSCLTAGLRPQAQRECQETLGCCPQGTGMSLAPMVPHGRGRARLLPRGRSSSGTSKNHIKLIGSQFTANKEEAGDIYLAE